MERRSQNMSTGISLAIRERMTEIQLNSLRRYNEELETKFKEDLNDTIQHYEKMVSETEKDSDSLEQIAEFCHYDKEAIKEFIKTLRYSLLVTSYSFLETSLDKLCHMFYKRKGISIPPSGLTEKGIDRSKEYLKKHCSVIFPSGKRDWQELKNLNKIRNCIVHANGNILRLKDKESKDLLKVIQDTSGVIAERCRMIVVDETYIPQILTNIENILGEVYQNARLKLLNYDK